ncbi:MAG TPA: RtcB family protein [Candidatus Saccharimonadales bacterium]|nr:RtcB family protein [Candidatus Saccharimonadales bacterium]
MSETALRLRKLNDHLWEIPRCGGMRVPGRVYASEALLREISGDLSLTQVANVAHLPGVLGYALAMPDIHQGYGFPIGGVAAMDAESGVVSPGGVGYDINCGVRLVRTRLRHEAVRDRVDRLADRLFATIPCGVGARGAIATLSVPEERKLVRQGAAWAVARGFGEASDLAHTEEGGCLEGADPEALSPAALQRGLPQVGTLGSGNHFLEVDRVDEVYRPREAAALGIETGQVVVIIHSGSRGLGHQTCDDHLRVMGRAMERFAIRVPDRQLACAPIGSEEGRRYLTAMACAANYAWVNRQVLMGLAERAFQEALGLGPRELGFRLVYDVCHNIAKFEEHEVEGRRRRVCVHRKGATRAFGPGHPAIPESLRAIGQPVLIPGDMGRYSFLLVGTQEAMRQTFGSTCHGAGRVMSRHESKRRSRELDLDAELARRGVTARYEGRGTLAEEMPHAYKDVAQVVDVMDQAGISLKVARFRPFAVIKG